MIKLIWSRNPLIITNQSKTRQKPNTGSYKTEHAKRDRKIRTRQIKQDNISVWILEPLIHMACTSWPSCAPTTPRPGFYRDTRPCLYRQCMNLARAGYLYRDPSLAIMNPCSRRNWVAERDLVGLCRYDLWHTWLIFKFPLETLCMNPRDWLSTDHLHSPPKLPLSGCNIIHFMTFAHTILIQSNLSCRCHRVSNIGWIGDVSSQENESFPLMSINQQRVT